MPKIATRPPSYVPSRGPLRAIGRKLVKTPPRVDNVLCRPAQAPRQQALLFVLTLAGHCQTISGERQHDRKPGYTGFGCIADRFIERNGNRCYSLEVVF